MKLKVKKIITLSLSLVISLVSVGCKDSSTKKLKENKTSNYIQHQIKIPEDRNIQSMMVLDDKSIAMTAINAQGDIYVLNSKDEGNTWSEKKVELKKEEGKLNSILQTSILNDGNILISYSSSDTNSKSAVAENVDVNYIMVDKNGNKKDEDISYIKARIMEDANKANGGKLFNYSNNGDLLFVEANNVISIDKVAKEEKNKYESDNFIQSYVIIDDSLIIWDEEKIIRYNIETGNKIEELTELEKELKSFEDMKTVLVGSIENKLYYSNKSGLYRYDINSKESEQLVNGNLSVFRTSGGHVNGFSQLANEELLISFGGSHNGLYKYTYSDNPTVAADKKLKVYSLQHNYDIENMVTQYLSSNPDIYVEYDYGLTGNKDSTTEDDAIKKLNTEILAGEGPDIILTEGLPIETYIEQGLLEDMSDVISNLTSEGLLFEGVKKASEIDGKIYTYPTSIAVPMIIGKKDVVNSISDLDTFSKTVKDLSSKSDNRIFDKYLSPKEFIYSLYYSYGYNLLNKDNSINKSNLEKFMAKSKEIYTVNNEKYKKYYDKIKREVSGDDAEGMVSKGKELSNLQEMISYTWNPIYAYSLFGSNEPAQLELGSVHGMNSYYSVISALTNDKDLDYKVLSQNNKSMLIPSGQVAITSNSADKEDAKAFISYMLSDEVQKLKSKYSFPVNKSAFKSKMEVIKVPNHEPYLDEANKRYVIATTQRTGFGEVKEFWPNEEDFNRIMKEIDNTKIIPMLNTKLLSEVGTQFEAYVNDQINLDKSIDNTIDNLELYLSE